MEGIKYIEIKFDEVRQRLFAIKNELENSMNNGTECNHEWIRFLARYTSPEQNNVMFIITGYENRVKYVINLLLEKGIKTVKGVGDLNNSSYKFRFSNRLCFGAAIIDGDELSGGYFPELLKDLNIVYQDVINLRKVWYLLQEALV